MNQSQRNIHVGIIGAGIGGLAAAIAFCREGIRVTILEAAEELGEIGAGIQMTPNVSSLLEKWQVSDILGANLVRISELNIRRKDGCRVGYAHIPDIEKALGRPWGLVHRAHLHEGLATVAKRLGTEVLLASRVVQLRQQNGDGGNGKVLVETPNGKTHTFDLCIGADGVNSVVRRTLFPDVRPQPPTTNCAYRAIVPYETVCRDPLAREVFGGEKKTMEVLMGEKGYIITYPICEGRDLNLVLSHHRPEKLHSTQVDVDAGELRGEYRGFDERIRRVVEMIPETSRWPLLVTGPLPSWSSPSKTIVMIGDAAHSMTNHMAQGAATSMEDGAFLAKCISAYVHGKLDDINAAVSIYETERMPKAHFKQQVSFLQGAIWHLPDGPLQRARDEAMAPEIEDGGRRYLVRSSNLYADPKTVLEVYGYDVEGHAEDAIEKYRNGGREVMHPETKVTRPVHRSTWWFAKL